MNEVNFAADDRLHLRLPHFFIEINRSEEITMIGHGHRRHSQFLGTSGQTINPASSIEQAVISVQVKVREILAFIGHVRSSVCG